MVLDLNFCALVAWIVTLFVFLECQKLKAARAGDAAGEALRAPLFSGLLREKWIGALMMLYYNNVALEEERDKLERALKETEEKMERLLDRRMQAECAAAVAEARLSDLRAWEKAVKLFSSALKDADASARAALCKDPEGEIEKLMEGQTVEKVTGEQAQEDAQQ